jgi:hypothetical protein
MIRNAMYASDRNINNWLAGSGSTNADASGALPSKSGALLSVRHVQRWNGRRAAQLGSAGREVVVTQM